MVGSGGGDGWWWVHAFEEERAVAGHSGGAFGVVTVDHVKQFVVMALLSVHRLLAFTCPTPNAQRPLTQSRAAAASKTEGAVP